MVFFHRWSIHSLLVSARCQSVSAAHRTGHVTYAEIRYKYFRKNTPEAANGGGGGGNTRERTAMFKQPSSHLKKNCMDGERGQAE